MVLPRQFCPEASRFGDLIVTSPNNATSYNPGDRSCCIPSLLTVFAQYIYFKPINIKVDFSCAINTFGIVPEYIDYTLEVPEQFNNGHGQSIVLARRTLAAGATSDTFTTTIPRTFYFTKASYNIFLTDICPIQGTDGNQVLIQGGTEFPITIYIASS